MYRFLLSSAFVTIFFGFSCAQEVWELRKEEDSIRIYTSANSDSKIRVIKAEFTLRATREELFNELLKADKYTEWQYNAIESVILEKPSQSEVTYHALVSAPWPVANRDLVVYLKINNQSAKDEFTIETTGKPDYVPVRSGVVRVPVSNGFWKVKQVGPRMLKIMFTMRIDPGGYVPAWLVNLTLAQAPFQTFSKLKARLER